MTDDDPDTQPMTDDTDSDDADGHGTDNPDQYDKRTIERFGERGSDIIKDRKERTDLDSMNETVENKVHAFCNCGTTHTDVDEVYRCCACDGFCCSRCHIEIRRYNYCPNCVQAEYGVNKPTFKALYLLDAGIIAADDLIEARTADNDIIDIQVSTAAETIIDHGFLQQDDDTGLDADDTLSPEGKEALYIGDKLFGGDPDIEEMKDDVKIKQVTDG